MPLYFAYGANMNADAMTGRCPHSRALGRARLAGYRLFIMAEGYASVAPERGSRVHGVLWDLAPADVAALDRFEEIGQGLYKKALLPVLREPFGSARALVYVGCNAQPGAPRAEYLQEIVASARRWALPPSYVAFLAGLARASPDGDSPGLRAGAGRI